MKWAKESLLDLGSIIEILEIRLVLKCWRRFFSLVEFVNTAYLRKQSSSPSSMANHERFIKYEWLKAKCHRGMG